MNAWHDFFFIRLADDIGYYIAWKGTKDNAFPDKYWRSHDNARNFAIANWRTQVDLMFEKEVLDGPEPSKADYSSED